MKNGRHGHTLMEVMVGLAALVVISGLAWSVVSATADHQSSETYKGIIEDEGRRGLEAMVRELRFADWATLEVTTYDGELSLIFQAPIQTPEGDVVLSGPIQYRYGPSNIDANRNFEEDDGALVRVQGNRERVLSHYIVPGGIQFTLENRGVLIRLDLAGIDRTPKGGHELRTTLQTFVAPRNHVPAAR